VPPFSGLKQGVLGSICCSCSCQRCETLSPDCCIGSEVVSVLASGTKGHGFKPGWGE
jgi:hypothetical protein